MGFYPHGGVLLHSEYGYGSHDEALWVATARQELLPKSCAMRHAHFANIGKKLNAYFVIRFSQARATGEAIKIVE